MDVGDRNSREIGKYVQADGFVACVSDIDTPSSTAGTTALETAAPTDAFCTEFVLAGGDAYNDDKMGTYAVLPGEFCGGKHKYCCVDCAYELDLSKKPKKNCKRKGVDDVRGRDACPETCGGCDAGDEGDDAACADSSSWYSKKSKNGCDWASKKAEHS